MSKKDRYVPHKSSSWNKGSGRRDGSSGSSKSSKSGSERERNVKHDKGEEHSRKPKGNRG
ncbi:hypothetical protein ACFLZC_02635 [Patescibacteria group bacterium]